MVNEAFQWKCEPKAERIIEDVLEACCEKNDFIFHLKNELHKHTSTRLFDFLDHVIVGGSDEFEERLQDAGFTADQSHFSYRVFTHKGAQLPSIIVKDELHAHMGVAVKVESIADFLMCHGIKRDIEGEPFSAYRRCCINTEDGASLFVVERRSTRSMEIVAPTEGHISRYFAAIEAWKSRPRAMEDEVAAMQVTEKIAEELVKSLGVDMASWVVLEVERNYWQSKNLAGQVQKGRQDRLGFGWANHDHHTFRSSRRHFMHLVRLFEILGFHCRERFYAGKEAGWGAQVMENSVSGLVLFLDVDLAPHELEYDFSHHPLPELDELGTIGLWCALHGDSILRSGMHHLEGQFFFEELTRDLNQAGVGMMEPFSNFPYLKQAFTAGEIWPVDPKRVRGLVEIGRITPEQAEKFLKYGAVGSHLENLQRREGYKGFNQKNVSFIIKKTDPRTIGA